MPKKLNRAGEEQNYNAKTGEYEGGVSGGEESKDESKNESKDEKKLSSFKKEPSEFDKANDKRMGKKLNKVEDWRISEALDDASWSVTQNTKVGQFAQEVADKLGIDKEDVLRIMSKEAGRELKEDENLSKILYPDEEEPEESEEPDEEGVGSVMSYHPATRQEDGSFKQTEKTIRAKKLNNGLAVETKAQSSKKVYAGYKGRYKVVDVDSGYFVAFVDSFEDAVKLSKDKEFIDKVNRARESLKKRRHED